MAAKYSAWIIWRHFGIYWNACQRWRYYKRKGNNYFLSVLFTTLYLRKTTVRGQNSGLFFLQKFAILTFVTQVIHKDEFWKKISKVRYSGLWLYKVCSICHFYSIPGKYLFCQKKPFKLDRVKSGWI